MVGLAGSAKTKLQNYRKGVVGCDPPTDQERQDIFAWERRKQPPKEKVGA